MDLKVPIFLSLVLIIIVLVLLAFHPAWYFHLQTDINVYFARANYFLQNSSFRGLVGNEYQPGALIFFIAASPILFVSNTFQSYLWSLFSLNILLILILAYLYKIYGDIKNIFIFVLILLFTGPIILFRFDLYVMSTLVASFFLFKKDHRILATAVLAYASIIKIFPVIFLPYYLIIEYKNRGLKESVGIFLVFLLSYISYLAVFSRATAMNFPQILGSFGFIANTPIHTESLWGTLTTLFWLIVSGEFAKGAGSWGIFGIAPEYQLGPLWFYNYFWLIPLSVFYLWLFFKFKDKKCVFDINVCLLIALLFLLFSKILHHQYLLWFMLLLPLVSWSEILTHVRWIILIFLTLLMTFVNQYIYPLHYSDWVFQLYVNGTYSYLFWLVALRNLILIFLFERIIKEFRRNISQNYE